MSLLPHTPYYRRIPPPGELITRACAGAGVVESADEEMTANAFHHVMSTLLDHVITIESATTTQPLYRLRHLACIGRTDFSADTCLVRLHPTAWDHGQLAVIDRGTFCAGCAGWLNCAPLTPAQTAVIVRGTGPAGVEAYDEIYDSVLADGHALAI